MYVYVYIYIYICTYDRICMPDINTKAWMQVQCGAEGRAGDGASHRAPPREQRVILHPQTN